MSNSKKVFKVGVMCGGPSLERGISLNSARSVMDHLQGDEIEIVPFYVDHDLNFFQISKSQLYSNTPSDFDFKIHLSSSFDDEAALVKELQKLDLVFPLIHGEFGEDGQLQTLLEKHNIPYVGPSATTCKKMFNKYNASQSLKQLGKKTLLSTLLKKENKNTDKVISDFFLNNAISKVVLKPVEGGSSIGVFTAHSPVEAQAKLKKIFQMDIGNEVIIEEFCQGKEFTIIVLQNPDNQAVALLPSEIQISYEDGHIFDYRSKYLPNSDTRLPCPANFSDEIIKKIQHESEEIFTHFEINDFTRMDGWVTQSGDVYFTDFNPISGMEQNSFMFKQAAHVGFNHTQVLNYIMQNACKRYGIEAPKRVEKQVANRKNVHVVFGGEGAESQVSLMSGTNVWLKLMHSDTFNCTPFFLDKDHNFWHLPYAYALNHTVEEILDNCNSYKEKSPLTKKFAQEVLSRIQSHDIKLTDEELNPKKYSLEQFLEHTKNEGAFVFIGLHGGFGENGDFQAILQAHDIAHNGSLSEASKLCMDKYLTGQVIKDAQIEGVSTCERKLFAVSDFDKFRKSDYERMWKNLQKEFASERLIAKPRNDGCSAGIVCLQCPNDLKAYAECLRDGNPSVPVGTFFEQTSIIEMPKEDVSEFMLERFIETDSISVKRTKLLHTDLTGWLELTVGVIEKAGEYHVMNPSITVAENKILSLEEKFQGGTGVNITPPPESLISATQLAYFKERVQKVAQALGISNYARIDIFFNIKTDELIVIEANSLPGLTPSTVIYHQALAEKPMMYPKNFLEVIISNSLHRAQNNKVALEAIG